ncbi:MAG: DivIVA domain-containing protein [Propionibacteriaceae bacterium]|jgi:DivIVA domain-containing protein|nr:DivIVA domain-containing protein [Propionibacteriaceae bacterium]
MTLTLEQVRATRFHLARRNGYEPSDVDDFVDKVEATLVQLLEENDYLKQQAEAAPAPQTSNIFAPVDSTPDEFKADLQASQDEIDNLNSQLSRLSADLQGAEEGRQAIARELSLRDEEIVSLRAEVQTLRQSAAAGRAVEQMTAPVPGQVENIVVTTSDQASMAVTRLLQMATEQAERLVGESKAEAQRLVNEARSEVENVVNNANKRAHETLTDARTRADRIESEARVNAEQVTTEARVKADSLTAEAERSRNEIIGKLESDRDVLRGKVESLRTFEKNYRANLTSHMEKQIQMITEAKLEPTDAPAVLSEPAPESSTPRLDALLGDQH